MSNRIDAARLLPIVMGVALGVGAARGAGPAAVRAHGRRAGAQARAARRELTALSQNMPLQAGAAVRGSAPAFDALADSRLRLDARAGGERCSPGAPDEPAPRVGLPCSSSRSRCSTDAKPRSRRSRPPRRCASSRHSCSPRSRTLSRRSIRRGPASAPQFERFELRAQAVDQDLSALADGTAPVEAASRRLTDSLDYMGRVTGGARRRAQRARHRAARRPPRRAPVRLLVDRLPERAGPGARRDRARRPARADAGGAQRAWPRAAPRSTPGSRIRGRSAPASWAGSRAPGCRCSSSPSRCSRSRTPRCCSARSPTCGAPPISRAARTSAISRRSCGCSTSCRAWPTATSRCRRP